jgi:GNAT superfamily N-acetyltransferase
MSDARAFLRFWHALDTAMERVEETPWGAVVSDARFPTIWDVNYARVDAERDVGLAEVRTVLDRELARTGARHEHLVCFWPALQTGLLSELGRGGNRISWDIVMIHRGRAPEPPAVAVEEVTVPDEAFWTAVRASLAAFDVTEPASLDQLMHLEREVALPDGKRWFAIRTSAGAEPLALGALIEHEGVAYLDHIVTVPEARKRGYGSAMVRKIVHVALGDGMERITLLADRGGKPAELYRRLGFEDLMYLASAVRRLPEGTSGAADLAQ